MAHLKDQCQHQEAEEGLGEAGVLTACRPHFPRTCSIGLLPLVPVHKPASSWFLSQVAGEAPLQTP